MASVDVDAEGRRKVLKLMCGIDFALIITQGAGSISLHARSMALPKAEDTATSDAAAHRRQEGSRREAGRRAEQGALQAEDGIATFMLHASFKRLVD